MQGFANTSLGPSINTRLLRLLALSVALLAAGNAFATITVGVGSSSCNYSTIQAAINAAAATDTITIASSTTPYKENLTINGKSLAISSCPCSEVVCLNSKLNNTIQPVVISGELATTPVLKITGTSTTSLDHITIENGHTGGADGGGIRFNATGKLTLTNTRVFGNTANYGAGINFRGTGTSDELHIGHDTFITDNVAAVSGGGIRLEIGDLYVVDKNTWIALNEAQTGYGGGIEVVGPDIFSAAAYIGSPGYLGSPVIYQNKANYGGGIALTSFGVVQFFSTDPLQPVAIGSNSAYSSGGAIHADTANNGSNICGQDFRLDGNIAPSGAAIFLKTNSSGGAPFVRLNQSDCPIAANLNAVACNPSVPCNTVHGNTTANPNDINHVTEGGILEFEGGANFYSDKLDIRGNHGGEVIAENGNSVTEDWYTDVHLHTCLIAENTTNLNLITEEGPGTSHLGIANCTIANNQIGSNSSVIAGNDYIVLDDNIIDQGASAAFGASGSGFQVTGQYNIAGNAAGLPIDPTNLTAVPTFIDSANGDYRLKYTKLGSQYFPSMGLDFAPSAGGTDIRGMAFDFDLGSVADHWGTRDLGAYEMHALADRVFVDTFGDPIQIAF